MISWLKGGKIDAWETGPRAGVIVECSGIGYEVQILKRNLELINDSHELTLWIHQVQREDGSSLIGFLYKEERNLFRKLISVNGIGSQLAITLLEKNKANQLIHAISEKKIDELTSCPGIGKRTAERLIIELQHKFTETSSIINSSSDHSDKKDSPDSQIRNEVNSALINLGYEESEINKAFIEFSKNPRKGLSTSRKSQVLNFEDLFKNILTHINTETGKKAP
ncbi:MULTISPECIES: Holliday junction branch migration protein RuvA [unclassified Prochlorococcus]|uniref:Holliday junction branch migration protein RuvA n=1 Tax=unclassified Prochlorococcus TaxID=2627481 RepID=UPI000533BCB3|nr:MULTISPECIES: Holliday junction branch migration protein RuvA [unclassified Prochlorococcus]KGG15067.1 Holliday junction DNA helicase RuvA [Prochlorococcus sp. MIT 0602]KGG17339.1 Holliday junction DNA helicase RuvA [Prochlorococcus sp. MIT 0603]